jgi:hypothetical protein
LQGQLDVTNHRIERIDATKADSQDLTRWANLIRDCLDEIADRNDATGDLQRSCGSRYAPRKRASRLAPGCTKTDTGSESEGPKKNLAVAGTGFEPATSGL